MNAARAVPARIGSDWRKTSVDEFRLVRRRVVRLAVVSAVALAFVLVAAVEDGAGAAVVVMLAAGWLSMPLVLLLVAAAPVLRTALALPATLVSLGVLEMAVVTSPSAGWLLLAAGIGLGGLVGAWLWFGWLPAPAELRLKPRSAPRLALMGTHVTLVVGGLALLAIERF